MSFLELYCEHEALLTRKGYDEESLHSPYRKGWMQRELLQHVGRAVKDMFYDSTPTDFTLKAVAFYNYKDIVQYHLNYRFEPEAGTLKLYRLDVQWEGNTKTFELKSNEDLPDAKKAFEKLKESSKVNARQNRKVKINQAKGNRKHL